MMDHSDNPFQSATGIHITITCLSMALNHTANMTIDNVVAMLHDNGILMAWADHSYAYGLSNLLAKAGISIAS
jgi:hypothetical protein